MENDDFGINLLINARKMKTTNNTSKPIEKTIQVVERKIRETPYILAHIDDFHAFLESKWDKLVTEFMKNDKLD
jgi:hypothetical protein